LVAKRPIEQFQTADWALDFGEANVKCSVRGVLPGGWVSLCFARGPGDSIWNGQPGGPGTLCCIPPGEEVDGHTVPGYSWMTIALPPAVWAQCRALAGLEDEGLHRYAACPLSDAQFAQVERQVRATHHLLRTSTGNAHASVLAHREAHRLATHLATSACEAASRLNPLRQSLRNRSRLARRASAWLRAHLAEPIQVPDVCLALRVSRRELEFAFRTTFDQSPRDYLQALRLNAMRRALQRGGASVTRAALDHGLTHLGRLAAQYRTLFGESPHETLNSGR